MRLDRSTKKQEHEKAEKAWLGWLDLSRYEQTKDLDRLGWAQQLSARSRILAGRWSGPSPTDIIRSVPLNLGAVQPELPETSTLRDMAWRDVVRLRKEYDVPGLREEVEAWEQEYGAWSPGDFLLARALKGREVLPQGPAHSAVLLEFAEIMDTPAERAALFYRLQEAHLVVNLAATDARLKAAFAQWLRERRAQVKAVGADHPDGARRPKREAKVQGTPLELERWHRSKVIPYLDVQIMAQSEGRKLPRAELLAEVLHGQGADDPVDAFKKHTAPLARLLVRPYVVHCLLLDAAQEALNRKNEG